MERRRGRPRPAGLCDAGRVAENALTEPPGDDKDWTWVLERRCDQCGAEVGTVARDALGERYFVAAEEWVRILEENPAVEQRPAPDRWSPLEYGAHVRDVYAMTSERLDLLLTRDHPVFADWDQDEAARAGRYAEQDPEQVADDLEAAAQRLVSEIGQIEPAAWTRSGTRSNGSEFTVETLLQYVLHDVVHHLWDVTGQEDAASSLQLG